MFVLSEISPMVGENVSVITQGKGDYQGVLTYVNGSNLGIRGADGVENILPVTWVYAILRNRKYK